MKKIILLSLLTSHYLGINTAIASYDEKGLEVVVTCRNGIESLGLKYKKEYFLNSISQYKLKLTHIPEEFAMLTLDDHYIGDVVGLEQPLCKQYQNIEWIYPLATNSELVVRSSTDALDPNKKVLILTEGYWEFTVKQ